MTAEFLRNTWLELTPMRRWALPVVVVLLLMGLNAGQLEPDQPFVPAWESMATMGLMMTVIFALWGAAKLAGSVTSEIGESTWDAQRLAEHQPVELLLGKLFGVTVFDWIGIAIGQFLFGISSLATGAGLGAIANSMLTMLLVTLLLHLVALTVSLSAAGRLRATRRPGRFTRNVGLGLLFLLLWPLSLLSSIYDALAVNPKSQFLIHWYWQVPISTFVPLSLALFIVWIFLGARHLLRAELQEPVGPDAWIGFQAFLVLYAYPFLAYSPQKNAELSSAVPSEALTHFGTLGVLGGLAMIVCGSAFYPLLLGERKDAVRWRRLWAAFSRGAMGAVWSQLPLWTFSLLGFWLGLALFTLAAAMSSANEAESVVAAVFSVGLFFLRDVGIVLAIQLAPRPTARPDLAVLFFGALLYLLIPGVARAFGEVGNIALYLMVPMTAAVKYSDSPWVLTTAAFALPGLAIAWFFAAPRLRTALATTPTSSTPGPGAVA